MRCDCLWTDARLATLAGPGLGVIEDGVVAAEAGRIVYAGPRTQAPGLQAARTVSCGGRWITPGLVDCHTHLVHGGNRAGEFERRLAGASYADIAQAGGGILSTMRATRAADEDGLVASALGRLDALLAEGVTTIEVKSGYDFTPAGELRMLRAARRLGSERRVTVVTTLLAAHAVPPEFAGDAEGYIDLVCEMLPGCLGLADAVDAFCESIAFSVPQVARLFTAAQALGLPVKLHADQLADGGGAAVAARFGALSADHLEHASEAGVAAMAEAGTVAVLLPGAYYTLRDTHAPPVAAFRRLGVPMALATDCNPGSAPLTSLLLAMNMGATLFRLTVEECLAGVTREAARALGRLDQVGTLEPGKRCDLAVWDIERPAELAYRMGWNPLHARVHGGITA